MLSLLLTQPRLKDHDVTWLYGPLQAGNTAAHPHTESPSDPKSTDKKPILKKRSMSEVMLMRSLSTSSLLKQAAAVIQSQKAEGHGFPSQRPNIGRGISDFGSYSFFPPPGDKGSSSAFPSSTDSELESPVSYQKHIHFNDTVDQGIALTVGADDDEEDYYKPQDSDDEGLVTMKTTRKKRKTRAKPRKSAISDIKTIAPLPSSTLKNHNETLGRQSSMHHSRHISPSPSLETLRPSRQSYGSGFFIQDNDDEDDENLMSWNPSPPSSTPTHGSSELLSRYAESSRGEGATLRKTGSGMFMPYSDEDEEAMNAGLFGKVVDTVNTAKDIAHVIWNVGWRK